MIFVKDGIEVQQRTVGQRGNAMKIVRASLAGCEFIFSLTNLNLSSLIKQLICFRPSES